MKKYEVIAKLEKIVEMASAPDNGFKYELKVNDWTVENDWGKKDRTYFAVVETRKNSKHYKKADYGYYDNIADEYVAGKANINYDFGGNTKI